MDSFPTLHDAVVDVADGSFYKSPYIPLFQRGTLFLKIQIKKARTMASPTLFVNVVLILAEGSHIVGS